MNNGEQRRMQILHLLKETGTPLSGTALAKELGVSRQVIVQDIALIRAENHNILSTNKGYIYRVQSDENTQPKRVFRVRHDTKEVLDEFLTVLVHLKLCDDAVGWVEWVLNVLAILLLLCDRIDVDSHFRELKIYNLSISVLEFACDNVNFIITADWKTLNAVCFL